MTYAEAAKKAIALGGKFDGHELPDDIHPVTKASAQALAGLGLMGVAKDTYPRDGDTYSFVVGFAEVEVDVETGKTTLVDYLAVARCGHRHQSREACTARSLAASTSASVTRCSRSGSTTSSTASPLARRFYQNKPLTILDVPATMHTHALGLADPETPTGARGVGEPPVGAGYGSVMNAIADAVGDEVFRRAPVMADIVLTSLEHGARQHDPLTSHL